MSFPAFLILLMAGAAVLALWILARYPRKAPAGLRRALLHFGFSLALVWVALAIVEPMAKGGGLSLVAALFLLVLPVLVYSCLAMAWTLSRLHKAIAY